MSLELLKRLLDTAGTKPCGRFDLRLDSLLVSANGPRGGLFLLADGVIYRLSHRAATGIWAEPDRLYCSFHHVTHAEIAILGANGQARTMVSTAVADIHDIRLYKGRLLVVSTSTNEIVAVSPAGEITERLKFPGSGDAWHLNCLDEWNGRLVVSAFGSFAWHSEWKANYRRRGGVFDMLERHPVWTGSSQPHSPRLLPDGTRLICDSYEQRLLVEKEGKTAEVAFPERFVRGLAAGKDNLYVGLSRARELPSSSDTAACSEIAVLSKSTYEKIGKVTLPSLEVYDIVVLAPQ